MKKIFSQLGVISSLLLTMFICTACPDDDDPELSVSTTEVSLKANGGDKDITVIANHTDWNASVTKGDSWLKVEKSQDGKVATIFVDANTTPQTRQGTVKITATADSELSYDIRVSQEGGESKPEIWANPKDELIMCYDYAHGVSCSASTKYFYISLYPQSTYNKMSEREVISDVVTGKVEDREVPDDDDYFSWDNLSENSSYVLAIVPYGDNDRQGNLFTKQIKTKSKDSEPDVQITGFSIDWDTDSYVWNVTKNTYCSSYYTYAVSSKQKFPTYYWMESGAYGLIAWAIRSEMEKDNSNHLTYINQKVWKDWGYSEYTAVEKFYSLQVNDGESRFTSNPLSDKYIQIAVWGTKSNGDLSGFLHFGYADWSGDTSVNRSRAIAPLKSPKITVSNGYKQKYIRGNLNDFNLIRI